MGILDDSDSDYSGSDGEYVLPTKTRKGSSTSSVLEGDIDQRLAALMKLKDEMGVSAEEAKALKEKEKHQRSLQEERARQKQKEQEAIDGMNDEEKIQYRKERAFSLMNKIKIKHEAMKDNSLSESGHTEDSTSHDEEEEDDMAEFKRLKALKEAKKKKKKDGKSGKTSKRHSDNRGKSSTSKSPMRRTQSEGTKTVQ